MDFDVALRAYLLDCELENRSAHTIRWYESKLGLLVRWLSESERVTKPEELTPEHVRLFMAHLRGTETGVGGRRLKGGKLSSLTLHGYMQAIKTFCKWLVAEEYAPTDASERIPMPKVGKYQVQAFTASEMRDILSAAANQRYGKRNHLVVFLLYDTALRVSELVGLMLDDVDFRNKVIRVRGKGDKQRTVPMGRTAHGHVPSSGVNR